MIDLNKSYHYFNYKSIRNLFKVSSVLIVCLQCECLIIKSLELSKSFSKYWFKIRFFYKTKISLFSMIKFCLFYFALSPPFLTIWNNRGFQPGFHKKIFILIRNHLICFYAVKIGSFNIVFLKWWTPLFLVVRQTLLIFV